MSIVGVDGFGTVIGQVAGLVSETTGFAAASSAATAAAAAVTPPGNDADSVSAVAQHNVTVAQFVAMMGLGIEQLGERAGETSVNSATFEALQDIGSAAVAAI
ncbi:hypothetical protein H7J07_05555 [Mycobacterium koreense]|uniref:Uncharacterized protein n=1 Tax=Mycolicibacillus koreensis TaxID=1069220 RepID=A0A7I7SDN6_9MYCO|nr:hypothetical protein [Mycolicibacillus koreensis]MCV7247690.1 hypothetical protein [Mycolicibacillus koreensis]OSC34774.1 hypothetical protein B8W67_05875 [Mycolicibacillus koreensis]BBY54075.1 hypothetical protein MKOR_13260 [Mycolicibacillus koreensis]